MYKRTTPFLLNLRRILFMANSNSNNNSKNNGNKMSYEEAGCKGAEATSDNHGVKFHQEIGPKGSSISSNSKKN